MLLFLTFLLLRPTARSIVPPKLLQFLLLILCLGSGTELVHLTSTSSYLKVMRQAPAIGVLWVWSVVGMDLSWAVVGLIGVGLGVTWRGELASAKWW